MNKEKLVEEGYDKIAEKYHKGRNRFSRKKELERFAKLLSKKVNANVLDAGCGSGIPVAKFLIKKGFGVTGVDISESMIKLARKNVPKAKFIKKNLTKLDFAKNSFDGITAFYSIIHIPKEKHQSIFKTFYKILKPEGIILVSLGIEEWEGVEEFHGKNMFWSHYSSKKSLKIIKNSGFKILFNKIIEDGNEKHYWIIARKK